MAKEKKDKGAYTTIWGVCAFLDSYTGKVTLYSDHHLIYN